MFKEEFKEASQKETDAQIKELMSKKSKVINDEVYKQILDLCTTGGYWKANCIFIFTQFMITNHKNMFEKIIEKGAKDYDDSEEI